MNAILVSDISQWGAFIVPVGSHCQFIARCFELGKHGVLRSTDWTILQLMLAGF